MNKLIEVIKEASKLVTPDVEEELNVKRMSEFIVNKVKEASKESPYKPEVSLQGSLAKGTWIKGELDIDVFLSFPNHVDKITFEKEGLKIGLKALSPYNPYLRYAEHPYVEAIVDKYKVNVVPCYKVEKGNWLSAADRTPYHTEYVKNNLKEEQKLEVRLLKKFFKGIGAYGAEIKVQGFSGYVCEILILKFGNFINVLNYLSNMKKGDVISLEKINEEFVRSKFFTPIIILDPIDNLRNLGEAISYDKLALAILSARKFLANPSIKFFKEDGIFELSQNLLNNMVMVKFKHKERSEDILWGQLRKSVKALKKQIEIQGFKVFKYGIFSNNLDTSCFIFLLDGLTLSDFYLKRGPSIFSKENCDKFLAKNYDSPLFWIGEDGNLYGLKRRDKKDISSIIKNIIEKKSGGISKGIVDELKESFQIIIGENIKEESWIKEEIIKFGGKNKLLFN